MRFQENKEWNRWNPACGHIRVQMEGEAEVFN